MIKLSRQPSKRSSRCRCRRLRKNCVCTKRLVRRWENKAADEIRKHIDRGIYDDLLDAIASIDPEDLLKYGNL